MLRLAHIRADAAPAFHRKECLQRYRDKKQRRHFSNKVCLPCVASAMPYSAPLHELPYVGTLLRSDLSVQRGHRKFLTVSVSMSTWHVFLQINMTLSYRAVAKGM